MAALPIWLPSNSALFGRYCKLVSSSSHNTRRNLHSSSPLFASKVAKPTDPRKHTVLIDGAQLFFRGYFAHKHLTNGALYGFTRLLLKSSTDMKPYDFIGVAGDGPRKESFRAKLNSNYKKNRKTVETEVGDQYRGMETACKAFNISYIVSKGFEADDVIATYTKAAVDKGHRVTIVTVDKDLMQLVKKEKVELYDFVNKKLVGEEEVLKRFGVKPEQVSHVQALIGDRTDNVLGVTGISAEMASFLIKQHNSVHELLRKSENLRSISSSVMKNLSLVKLREDAPVPPLETLQSQATDDETIIKYFKTVGFPSLVTQWIKHRPEAAKYEGVAVEQQPEPPKNPFENVAKKKTDRFEPALVSVQDADKKKVKKTTKEQS